MAMQDWIHKYPGVQQLLQQPDEVLQYPGGAVRLGTCIARTVARNETTGAPLPEGRCQDDATEIAPDGRRLCAFHYDRLWVHPCCGRLRQQGISGAWGPDEEFQYWRSPYAWCDECSDLFDGIP